MAKKLSPAMFNWAKANMSKLKNPTAAQKKIFEQYKAMVKAGDTPANPKPRPKAAPKPAAPKPRQTTPAEAKERFFRSSSQGSIAKNEEKAKSNFFRSSSGTRGQNMPSNPALKSQPKKPSRSDFATGRTGSTRFAEAMRKYRAARARVESAKPKVKRNRRGRAI